MGCKLQCEKKPPDKRGKAKRGSPFRHVAVLRYDESADVIIYRHFTKGIRTRRATRTFLSELGLPAYI
jgi:hypothetical protein